ncbi:Mitochondrial inner membrane translocase subunit Tim17/Tim22/Tim23/peroxisomal protein PMP24 [Artemisia annua]|uniref:Mitochondrial inner membrane translocase subunit Tim17/Tim22/Tim23/peroxisomal protein PMP24 n=1 Tax=Artemisia annua TaxID=35608 RepID=A0A2U1NEJ1_ARTAN|nr:Mitochondrial inner membrane translocase subunit Tim17/Tim22/Tim23/peroxisomal protein PMP24 [Artemisia annua]
MRIHNSILRSSLENPFMGDEKKEALAMSNHNSVAEQALANTELKTSYKCIRNWVAKQALPLKVVVRDVATIVEATFHGACRGFVFDIFFSDACSKLHISPPSSQFLSRCGEYQPLVRSLTLTKGGNLEHIRNFAVMGGVNAAISCVLKNIKGKEDVSTR